MTEETRSAGELAGGGPVRGWRAEGLEERVGYFDRRVSMADVIDELQGGTGTGAGSPAAQTAPAK